MNVPAWEILRCMCLCFLYLYVYVYIFTHMRIVAWPDRKINRSVRSLAGVFVLANEELFIIKCVCVCVCGVWWWIARHAIGGAAILSASPHHTFRSPDTVAQIARIYTIYLR